MAITFAVTMIKYYFLFLKDLMDFARINKKVVISVLYQQFPAKQI